MADSGASIVLERGSDRPIQGRSEVIQTVRFTHRSN